MGDTNPILMIIECDIVFTYAVCFSQVKQLDEYVLLRFLFADNYFPERQNFKILFETLKSLLSHLAGQTVTSYLITSDCRMQFA